MKKSTMKNLTMKKSTIKNKSMKSFSPSLNKNLEVASLKSLKAKDINVCDDLLKINIGTKAKPKCLNYSDEKTKKILLYNLKASKHLNPDYFIGPKQLTGNCWFNTMFVTFFFSDKGRKFFRFFRELMIKGVKMDNTPIEDNTLRKLFFTLNLFIEASYNQNQNHTKKQGKKQGKKGLKNTKKIGKKGKHGLNKNKNKNNNTNKKILYEQINNLIDNLNTNYFIKVIHDRINHLVYEQVPDIHDAGNPISFYKTIMRYLDYNIIKMMQINIYENTSIKRHLQSKFENYYIIPDIIILEDSIQSNSKNTTQYDTYYKLVQKNVTYKYVLDSIILTNKSHYKPRANSHFVSVLTINGQEYRFDGDSYSRLSKFKWKNLINKNKDWVFRENPNIYPEKYNFTMGYKMLFYYRVN